jgi:hypothetical protein
MAINLKDFCKNIADSIRAKEGSSELINPQDFSKRIDNLQVGGGGYGWGHKKLLEIFRCE